MPFILTCNALNASFIIAGVKVTPGIIPLAVAKALADKKFLTWVIGDKIVLAICDVALGYKIKFSYALPSILFAPKFCDVSSNASAIPLIANLPFKGFVIPSATWLCNASFWAGLNLLKSTPPAANFLPGSILIALNSSLNKPTASSLVSASIGRNPAATLSSDFLTKLSNIWLRLVIIDNLLVPFKIVCKALLSLPNNSWNNSFISGFKSDMLAIPLKSAASFKTVLAAKSGKLNITSDDLSKLNPAGKLAFLYKSVTKFSASTEPSPGLVSINICFNLSTAWVAGL